MGRRSNKRGKKKKNADPYQMCNCNNGVMLVKRLSHKPFKGFVYFRQCKTCGCEAEIEDSKASSPVPPSVSKKQKRKQRQMTKKIEEFETANKFMAEDASVAALSMVSYGMGTTIRGGTRYGGSWQGNQYSGRSQIGGYDPYDYYGEMGEEYWRERFGADVGGSHLRQEAANTRAPNFVTEKINGFLFEGSPEHADLIGIVDGREAEIKIGDSFNDNLGKRGYFKITKMRRGVGIDIACKLMHSSSRGIETLEKLKKNIYTATTNVTIAFCDFVAQPATDTIPLKDLEDDSDLPHGCFVCLECGMNAFAGEQALEDVEETDSTRKLIKNVEDDVDWNKFQESGVVPPDVSLFDVLCETGKLDCMCLRCRRETLCDMSDDDVSTLLLEYTACQYLGETD